MVFAMRLAGRMLRGPDVVTAWCKSNGKQDLQTYVGYFLGGRFGER